MYYNPRKRRPAGYDWMQDQIGLAADTDFGTPPPTQHEPEELDFNRYPTWAHGVMAQVYPRLDHGGRLPEPLILEDSSEIGDPTEAYVLKHPDCRRPVPMSPRCAQQWRQAEATCSSLSAQNKLPDSGQGWGRSYEECVCGHITQDCGGNPHKRSQWDRPGPKRRRRWIFR